MPGRRFRIFSREFKEAAVRRVMAGEKVRAVAEDLRFRSQLLYVWLEYYEQGGVDALVPRGRPRNTRGRCARSSWNVPAPGVRRQ